MIISIHDQAGRYALTLQDGQQIYERIHPELAGGERVVLDFAGVDIFAAPFFNAAIGQLLRDFHREDLDSLLEIRNLSPDGHAVLRRVIANATHYYAEGTDRERLGDIVSSQIKQRIATPQRQGEASLTGTAWIIHTIKHTVPRRAAPLGRLLPAGPRFAPHPMVAASRSSILRSGR